MTVYGGATLSNRAATVGNELPIESDTAYTPARAQGTLTDAMIEDYFNAPIRQISYGQAGASGHDYQSINGSGEIVVHYPANQWVKGTGTWFDIEPVQEMWAAVDIFVPTGHDFVLSGKMGLGLFAGNHNHNSGGGGLDNDDAASVRLHWTVRGGSPEIDLYVYWPEMKSLGRQYGQTIQTGEVIPTNTWQRYIIGLDLGTPGSSDGSVSLWKRAVSGSSTEVTTNSYKMQLTGIPFDIDVFKFATFYGGSGSQYAPSTAQTTQFKHFKVGTTRDSVDDSPIVVP